MEHIGHAAWRVLQNAKKAAIAREKEIADAEKRGPALFEVATGKSPATLRPEASATVEYPGERKRSRHKGRSTGSKI